MASKDSPDPQGPERIVAFANFFKKYMGISSVVAAALPIPVTAMGLIPTYKFQTNTLATLTSLFCFLVLAFIFFSRHQLARFMFPEVFQEPSKSAIFWRYFVRLLPLLFILSSLYFVFKYQALLTDSISGKRRELMLPTSEVDDPTILEKSYLSQTSEATLLMINYLGIFITAEAAFILMAIKEYLQDRLRLDEFELIYRLKINKPSRQQGKARRGVFEQQKESSVDLDKA